MQIIQIKKKIRQTNLLINFKATQILITVSFKLKINLRYFLSPIIIQKQVSKIFCFLPQYHLPHQMISNPNSTQNDHPNEEIVENQQSFRSNLLSDDTIDKILAQQEENQDDNPSENAQDILVDDQASDDILEESLLQRDNQSQSSDNIPKERDPAQWDKSNESSDNVPKERDPSQWEKPYQSPNEVAVEKEHTQWEKSNESSDNVPVERDPSQWEKPNQSPNEVNEEKEIALWSKPSQSPSGAIEKQEFAKMSNNSEEDILLFSDESEKIEENQRSIEEQPNDPADHDDQFLLGTEQNHTISNVPMTRSVINLPSPSPNERQIHNSPIWNDTTDQLKNLEISRKKQDQQKKQIPQEKTNEKVDTESKRKSNPTAQNQRQQKNTRTLIFQKQHGEVPVKRYRSPIKSKSQNLELIKISLFQDERVKQEREKQWTTIDKKKSPTKKGKLSEIAPRSRSLSIFEPDNQNWERLSCNCNGDPVKRSLQKQRLKVQRQRQKIINLEYARTYNQKYENKQSNSPKKQNSVRNANQENQMNVLSRLNSNRKQEEENKRLRKKKEQQRKLIQKLREEIRNSVTKRFPEYREKHKEKEQAQQKQTVKKQESIVNKVGRITKNRGSPEKEGKKKYYLPQTENPIQYPQEKPATRKGYPKKEAKKQQKRLQAENPIQYPQEKPANLFRYDTRQFEAPPRESLHISFEREHEMQEQHQTAKFNGRGPFENYENDFSFQEESLSPLHMSDFDLDKRKFNMHQMFKQSIQRNDSIFYSQVINTIYFQLARPSRDPHSREEFKMFRPDTMLNYQCSRSLMEEQWERAIKDYNEDLFAYSQIVDERLSSLYKNQTPEKRENSLEILRNYLPFNQNSFRENHFKEQSFKEESFKKESQNEVSFREGTQSRKAEDLMEQKQPDERQKRQQQLKKIHQEQSEKTRQAVIRQKQNKKQRKIKIQELRARPKPQDKENVPLNSFISPPDKNQINRNIRKPHRNTQIKINDTHNPKRALNNLQQSVNTTEVKRQKIQKIIKQDYSSKQVAEECKLHEKIKRGIHSTEIAKKKIQQMINTAQNTALRQGLKELLGIMDDVNQGMVVSRCERKVMSKNLRRAKKQVTFMRMAFSQSMNTIDMIRDYIPKDELEAFRFFLKQVQSTKDEQALKIEDLKPISFLKYYEQFIQGKKTLASESSSEQSVHIDVQEIYFPDDIFKLQKEQNPVDQRTKKKKKEQKTFKKGQSSVYEQQRLDFGLDQSLIIQCENKTKRNQNFPLLNNKANKSINLVDLIQFSPHISTSKAQTKKNQSIIDQLESVDQSLSSANRMDQLNANKVQQSNTNKLYQPARNTASPSNKKRINANQSQNPLKQPPPSLIKEFQTKPEPKVEKKAQQAQKNQNSPKTNLIGTNRKYLFLTQPRKKSTNQSQNRQNNKLNNTHKIELQKQPNGEQIKSKPAKQAYIKISTIIQIIKRLAEFTKNRAAENRTQIRNFFPGINLTNQLYEEIQSETDNLLNSIEKIKKDHVEELKNREKKEEKIKKEEKEKESKEEENKEKNQEYKQNKKEEKEKQSIEEEKEEKKEEKKMKTEEEQKKREKLSRQSCQKNIIKISRKKDLQSFNENQNDLCRILLDQVPSNDQLIGIIGFRSANQQQAALYLLEYRMMLIFSYMTLCLEYYPNSIVERLQELKKKDSQIREAFIRNGVSSSPSLDLSTESFLSKFEVYRVSYHVPEISLEEESIA